MGFIYVHVAGGFVKDFRTFGILICHLMLFLISARFSSSVLILNPVFGSIQTNSFILNEILNICHFKFNI